MRMVGKNIYSMIYAKLFRTDKKPGGLSLEICSNKFNRWIWNLGLLSFKTQTLKWWGNVQPLLITSPICQINLPFIVN